MPEIEAHAITITILQRDAFRAGRMLAHVAQGIHVRADMIAENNHAMSGEPIHAVFCRADARGELRPRLVHQQRGTHDAREADHVVVDGHAEINEFSGHKFLSGL